MNADPAWLEVAAGDAAVFARRVLEYNDSTFCRWILEQVDLASGSFGATASYVVEEDGLWNDAGADTEINRVVDPESPSGFRLDLKVGVRRIVGPLLKPGRVLIVWNSFTEPRLSPQAPSESDVRLVQREHGEGRFETYFVVPGPAARPEDIDTCIWHAIVGSTGVGVVSEVSTGAVPEDGELLTDERFRSLVTRPALVFMRMISYDGFLIWRSSQTTSDQELRTIGKARS